MIILLSYIRAPFAYTTVNFYDDVLPLLIFFSFLIYNLGLVCLCFLFRVLGPKRRLNF